MAVNPFGLPGRFDPWSGFNAAPPPPASPPGPPPADGVDTVVVTGQRQGRFETEAQARDFGIALIQAQPDRNRREYGLFVVKIGDRYDVSELIVGEGRNGTLGRFTRDGSDGTNAIPTNAVGFLHSHPPGIWSDVPRVYNMYLSEQDIMAWRFFKEVTENPGFKMWVIGPDGDTREFDQESDVPPAALQPPRVGWPDLRPPDPRLVPDVGPDLRWNGPPGPDPVAPPSLPGSVSPVSAP